MDYNETIRNGYLRTVERLEAMGKALEQLPKGTIVVHHARGHEYPYLHYYEHGHSHAQRIDGDVEAMAQALEKRKLLIQ